jgi:N-acetylmuramic acid 6-phosphate (MurNAc-6-P) etherase
LPRCAEQAAWCADGSLSPTRDNACQVNINLPIPVPAIAGLTRMSGHRHAGVLTVLSSLVMIRLGRVIKG